MSQQNRLSTGGRVDRSRKVRFTFEGKSYEGFAGDTLASALLANNVHLVGRSFKYHRPRGVLTAGSEEPNAIVQLGTGARTEPNTRAPMIELYDGLNANPQNCWPSVNSDIGEINNKLSRFFPAGFYYKTFMWPKSMWMKYEEVIRHSAGMGVAPTEEDPDSYATKHVHCDVLVAGGGPAGLAAALAAGRSGARVIIADEHGEFGGSLLGDADATIDGKPAMEWVASAVEELKAMEEVTVLPRTTVTAYYDHNFLTALERVTDHLGPQDNTDIPRQRFWQIRAKEVVIAQGSVERPMLFGDNDRPGVMLASAVRTYINRFGVLPGREVVVFTNNDSAYRTAIDAVAAGATVHVVDTRKGPKGALVEKARSLGVDVHDNCGVIGTCGKKKVTGVDVMELNEAGDGVVGSSFHLSADIVAMSSGWTPMVSLYSQARGKLRYDEELSTFLPDHCQWANHNVGACNGDFTLEGALSQGFEAGAKSAKNCGFGDGAAPATPKAPQEAEEPLRVLWYIPSDKPLGRKRKHFHEFQNDSTVADIHIAAREGFISVEHLKRYTTTGMGTDQGKTSNVNAIGIMSGIRQIAPNAVGTTTFRPPYTPLTFGAATGHGVKELFLQKRKSPMHPAHEAHGAVYEDVGDWKRPRYFPKDGEDMHAAVQRECKQVRETVGMLDATTLGKIDIQGPDAAKFLNMIYTNAWLKLGVGKARYGLMCNEHGMVFDDGVTTRLGENHFHMTTTTGGAGRVANWLEEWLQTEWPEMEVYCTSVTEQWAVMGLNGPMSRDLLSELCDDIDLSGESFKFMEMREGHVAGVPARVYRISFTGELAFEINVPARYGLHVWNALIEAGKKYDLVLYGTESMHVLRAEKGFIIAGQDTDGSVTPMDLDMSWIVGKNKEDFLGRRSFARSDTSREGRKQMVGILTEDPNVVLPEGAHVVKELKDKPPMEMLGHISSSYMSPNCGRSIAMGLIKDGFKLKGQSFYVPLIDGATHKVTITDPIFFDKEGVRSRG
ncbi:sarcosine oxidase subunit alpha family protein [Aestuariispira ectoiniformans]|uniref:sarcosine oxidase subunit alpha family protein n=1 Tax=Aestuariispira ectoiniformans TaxID=2775080 RepID=UPI00223BB1F7|nr:sarcosine oxidase subunit alpha family protein [Aestuariispira ectoiniformans]